MFTYVIGFFTYPFFTLFSTKGSQVKVNHSYRLTLWHLYVKIAF